MSFQLCNYHNISPINFLDLNLFSDPECFPISQKCFFYQKNDFFLQWFNSSYFEFCIQLGALQNTFQLATFFDCLIISDLNVPVGSILSFGISLSFFSLVFSSYLDNRTFYMSQKAYHPYLLRPTGTENLFLPLVMGQTTHSI